MRLDWKQTIVFSTTLKNAWFDSLQGLSHHEFKKKTVAEYISYQSNDLDALEKDFLPPLVSLFKQLLRMGIYTIVISATVNVVVAVILLCTAGLAIQIPKMVGKKTAIERKKYLTKQGEYYHSLEDLFTGHHLVNRLTASHLQKRQRTSLDSLQKNYLHYGLTKILGIILTGMSFELTGLVLFLYLSYALYHNQIGVPEVVASFSYITAFSEPIQEVLYDLQMLESVKPVTQSFLSIVQKRPTNKEPVRDFSRLLLKNISKNIGERVLTIPLLSIGKGEKIVLIGDNGSGKTSFLNILNGTDLDYTGDVFLDDCKIDSLEGRFGFILQQEHTFTGSYQDNIGILGSFPIQFSEPIFFDKRAESLSGGERQKMYLAREINRQAPLIIMDEPFSALDRTQFDLEIDKVLNLPQAVVMTLHQREDVLEKFDHVWEIVDGTIQIVR